MSYVIKLCSRNQTTGAVSRTDISTNILNGFSVVEKLDESLDVGNIVLYGLSSESSSPFNMFDWIEIYEDTTLLYSLRIAGDNVRMISKNPVSYEHTLSLVEHTKILERFQINGKTFTQSLSGTLDTYLDILNELLRTIPFETSDNLTTTRICVLPTSGSLYTFLSTTNSPEFTFKGINLREAIKQVGDSFDGIPRLYINSSDELELTFDFVNELKELITSESDFIEKSIQQNIELHATNLESNVLNLVNDITENNESVEYYPADGSYISPRTDGYYFDFTKSYIPTPKPIYRIDLLLGLLNVKAYNDRTADYLYGTALTLELIDLNLTPRIVEYNTFKTLDETGTTLGELYRRTTLFYEYKKNNIQLGETYGLFDTKIVLDSVVEEAILDQLIDEGLMIESDRNRIVLTYSSTQDMVYRVQYEPLPNETRLSMERQDNTDVSYNSSLVSNQQSRLVNLEQFSNNLYGRINRIGNSELQLSNREVSSTDLYNIGDYTDDLYIITEKEVIFFKDYVYAKYGLSRNFNKISDFIGINSEIRQWEIGEKNTLNRNVFYNEHIEIEALPSGSGSDSSQLMQSDGIKSYIDTLYTSSTEKPVRGSIMGSAYADDVLMPMSSNGGGNSLIFSWELPSNVYAGSFVEDIGGQIANNFELYTTEDGGLPNFTLYLFDSLNTGDTSSNDYKDTADNYPKTDTTYINKTLLKNDSVFILNKDNREIIGGTIQLQQKPKDSSNLGFGRVFSSRNRLVSENPPTTIKLYVYTNGFKFDRTYTGQAPSGYASNNTAVIVPNYTNLNINITNSELTTNVDSYCLTDENDNILIWVNQDGVELDFITFDFKNKSSYKKYKY